MRLLKSMMFTALVACSKQPTVPLISDLAMAVGQTDAISGDNFSIKFVGVNEDSRCPIDVQCVWAGNAQIQLEARFDGQTTSFALNTTVGAKEVVVNSYRIKLLELTPAPTSTAPIPLASYRAKLSITRPGTVCTEEARPAFMVTLTDSVSGNAISSFTGVSVVARAGVYEDSVAQATYPATPYGGPIALAYERAGTYTLRVRAEGYALWSREGVVVTADQCHVVTVPITARLAR